MSVHFSNHVSGFFDYREQAENVMSRLIASGFARNNLHLIDKYAKLPTHVMKESNAAFINDLVLEDERIHDAVLAGKVVVIAEMQRSEEMYLAEKIIKSVAVDSYEAIES